MVRGRLRSQRPAAIIWRLGDRQPKPVEVPRDLVGNVAKKSNGVVRKNSGASLVDLGDGVGCLEFHSKMNSLGSDIVRLITQSLKPGGPGDNFDAFVIANDATNFSVGANLMLLLMSIQEDEWDDVDLAIRQFQGMTQAIKFSPKPVVSAPFGFASAAAPKFRCTPQHDSRMRNFTRAWSKSASACCLAAEAAKKCCCAPWTARQHRAARFLRRSARRFCRNDGGHEEGFRNHRHGQGRHVGARSSRPWISSRTATASP